jgi:hypothetical protein
MTTLFYLGRFFSSSQTGRGAKSVPYYFNSLLSSLKKRQSVLWAMSFCGLDLIIPASCRRRA